MPNYNRGIIKQIEELTKTNEVLERANRTLKLENRELVQKITRLEDSLDARISKALEKAVTPLHERINYLECEVVKKDAEISRLKAQLNKNSSNSSKPPGTDGFKKIVNSREKSGKTVGGQPGHKGTTLTLPSNMEDLLKEGKAKKELVDYTNGSGKYVSKWKIDLETMVVYTEYRYPEGEVPCVYYGENIKALSVLLSNDGLIAHNRLSDFISDVTGGQITMSVASIEKFNRIASLNVDIESLKQELLNGEVMNTDETQLRCTQILEYDTDQPKTAHGTTFGVIVRTHSNANTTLYTINPHKDDKGIDADGIIPSFCGILAHDHDKKLYKYGNHHATCGAHLSRELKGLHELFHVEWAGRFRKFYTGLNDYKNETEYCPPGKLIEFEYLYDQLLDEGDSILGAMAENSFGYKEFKPILKRLRIYKDAYLLFIRNYKAPFTNNQAERDLRPCKTKQKVSGCFRSWQGIISYARIRSFISTVRKRKLPLLDSIKGLFCPYFFYAAE